MKIVRERLKLNYNQYILLGGQRHLWYFIQSVPESSQEAHHLVWKTNTQVNKNIKMNMINSYMAVHFLPWKPRREELKKNGCSQVILPGGGSTPELNI